MRQLHSWYPPVPYIEQTELGEILYQNSKISLSNVKGIYKKWYQLKYRLKLHKILIGSGQRIWLLSSRTIFSLFFFFCINNLKVIFAVPKTKYQNYTSFVHFNGKELTSSLLKTVTH